jgi:hypothetical protein
VRTVIALSMALVACCPEYETVGRSSFGLLDPGTAWTRHTIHDALEGADGVDLADVDGDGDLDATSGWEESGIVTVSLHPADPTTAWPTVRVNASLLYGVEDAVFADIDADGRIDVVSASESKRISIHFAPALNADLLTPSAWTTVTLTAATNVQRWIKVDVADMNADGRLDIIAGGKVSPATVGIFTAPTNPRTASAWTYAAAGAVGWTMGLEARDVDSDSDLDIVLSDREYISNSDGTRTYTLQGTRWLKAPSWTNHPIGTVAGNGKFFQAVDWDGDSVMDVIDGRSSATFNQTYLKQSSDGWMTWTETAIAQPSSVGHYHDVAIGDIDGDSALDYVFSYSMASGSLSGIAAVLNDGTRVEISGDDGTKFDTLELVDIDADGDLDAVTSEQDDGLGLVWYENPLDPESVDAGSIDAGPADASPPDAAMCTCPCEP